MREKFRNGPNTVSESTVSNTKLSELFCPHQVPGRELSECLSAFLCVWKRTHRVFFAELTELAAELSEFFLPKQCSRNSILPVSYKGTLLSKKYHSNIWLDGLKSLIRTFESNLTICWGDALKGERSCRRSCRSSAYPHCRRCWCGGLRWYWERNASAWRQRRSSSMRGWQGQEAHELGKSAYQELMATTKGWQLIHKSREPNQASQTVECEQRILPWPWRQLRSLNSNFSILPKR